LSQKQKIVLAGLLEPLTRNTEGIKSQTGKSDPNWFSYMSLGPCAEVN